MRFEYMRCGTTRRRRLDNCQNTPRFGGIGDKSGCCVEDIISRAIIRNLEEVAVA